jgi:arsenate reductase-like glutaredoxin family protein
MTGDDVVVWYNPRCSKCRGAEELLASYGVPAQKILYLDNPPGRAEIARVLALLGTDDWADRAVIARPPNSSCRSWKPAATRTARIAA